MRKLLLFSAALLMVGCGFDAPNTSSSGGSTTGTNGTTKEFPGTPGTVSFNFTAPANTQVTNLRIVLKRIARVHTCEIDEGGHQSCTDVDTELSKAFQDTTPANAGSVTFTVAPTDPTNPNDLYTVEVFSAHNNAGVNSIIEYGKSAGFAVTAGSINTPSITLGRANLRPTLTGPASITVPLDTSYNVQLAKNANVFGSTWDFSYSSSDLTGYSGSQAGVSSTSTSSITAPTVANCGGQPLSNCNGKTIDFTATLYLSSAYLNGDAAASWKFTFPDGNFGDTTPTSSVQGAGTVNGGTITSTY